MIHILLAQREMHTRTFAVELFETLKEGEVAKVSPEGDETVRILKNSLKRVAKELRLSANVYDKDGFVYVKLE